MMLVASLTLHSAQAFFGFAQEHHCLSIAQASLALHPAQAFFDLLLHTGEKQESGLNCYVSGNKCVSLRQKRVKGKDYGNIYQIYTGVDRKDCC